MPTYQVTVVNIKYGDEFRGYRGERPDSMVLDVPKSILDLRDQEDKFRDSLESFACNTITRMFGSYVSFLQVFLPLD